MRNILLKILFVFLSYHAECQTTNNCRQDSILLNEIESFTLRVKSEFLKNSNYEVFVIRGFSNDTCQDCFCLTMSYILNSFEYERVHPTHYLSIDDKTVIISLDVEFDCNIFNPLELNIIDSIQRKKFIKRLFPEARGGATYSPQVLDYCKVKNKILITFFNDDSNTPPSRYIYRNFPPVTIERIDNPIHYCPK